MTDESNAALAEDEGLDTEFDTAIENESEAPEATASSDTETTSEESPVVEIDENQKAINKLAFEKREEKRLRKAADDRVRELEAQLNQQKPVEKPNMPTEGEFDYDPDKYNAAMAAYQSDLVKYEVQQTLNAQREQEKTQLSQQKRQANIASFEAKVAESGITDFYEATSKVPQLQQEVLDSILTLDNSVNVAYYLSQHLDQADVIASSDPISAALRIGEISARLKATTKTTKPSAAPDPVKPINQGGAGISEADSELIAGATFE